MKKIVCVTLFGLALACGTEEVETVETELCEHMKEGPAVSVDAETSETAEGPDVSEEHTRFDVALAEGSGLRGGHVVFKATRATDFVVGMNAQVPMAVARADGTEVPVSTRRIGADACTEVAIQYMVALEVGSSRITLGPTDRTSVSLVIEPNEPEE